MSSSNSPAFQIKPFPLSRRAVIDSGRVGRRKHTISGLIEVDVTEARRCLHMHKERTGEAVSFTAFVLTCLGAAIDHNKHMHAYRDLWGRLILFEDVDCTIMIEIDFQGQKFPLAHIVRSINRRSLRSIHDEIRSIQTDPHNSPSLRGTWYLFLFLILPGFVRDLFYRFIIRSPRLLKRHAGTVMLSVVGMFGASGGWGLSTGSMYTTSLLLGGISEKPAVVGGEIAAREFLSMTLSFDHDVIDGAPAARFAARLKGLIESAYGMDSLQAQGG